MCECGEEGSLEHIIWNCNINEDKNSKFLDVLYNYIYSSRIKLVRPFNLQQLVQSSDIFMYNLLYKHVVNCNISL